MSTKKNQHVVPENGKWAVKGAGNKRITKRLDRKDQAIRLAKRIARKKDSMVIIHGADGRVQKTVGAQDEPFLEGLEDIIGSVEGPSDLSHNPRHMDDYGAP